MKRPVNRLTSYILLAFLFTCACTGQAAPVTYPSDRQHQEQISGLVEREMAKTGTVGLSIVVIDDQRIVWAEGFGWADKLNRVPATPETIYQVASVTKLFTAFAAMQLAEQGKLDIDRPIQSYLPAFALKTRYPQDKPITSRTIMTHHSGIPSDYFDIDLDKPSSLVTLSLNEQYACFPPDYVFSYSNPAFIVLGDVIAAASGRSYHQQVRSALLEPLGMNRSFFKTEFGKETGPNIAKGYEKGKERPPLPTTGILPAAGLHSTANDLAKFVRVIFADGRTGDNQLLTKEAVTEMLRAQNENIPLDGSYRVGLGWMLSDSSVQYAGRNARHGGHINNHAANVTLLPDHKLGVVVLANSAEAYNMLGTIADETLKALLALKKGITPPVKRAKPSLAKVVPSAQSLAGLTGYYATEIGVIRVTSAHDKLIATTSDFKLQMQPHEQGLFSMHHSLLGLFPVRIFENAYFSFTVLGNRKVIMMHDDKGTLVIGEKAPEPFLPDVWRDIAGTYELTGRQHEFTLLPQKIDCVIENDRVIIKMANPLKEYPLIKTWSVLVQPLSPSEGIIVGLGQRKGDTVRREMVNGVPHILIAGLDYKKIPGLKH